MLEEKKETRKFYEGCSMTSLYLGFPIFFASRGGRFFSFCFVFLAAFPLSSYLDSYHSPYLGYLNFLARKNKNKK